MKSFFMLTHGIPQCQTNSISNNGSKKKVFHFGLAVITPSSHMCLFSKFSRKIIYFLPLSSSVCDRKKCFFFCVHIFALARIEGKTIKCHHLQVTISKREKSFLLLNAFVLELCDFFNSWLEIDEKLWICDDFLVFMI